MQDWNVSITYEPELVESKHDGKLQTQSIELTEDTALDAMREALREWVNEDSNRYANIIVADITAMPFETGEYERFESTLGYRTMHQIQTEYDETIRERLANNLERISF